MARWQRGILAFWHRPLTSPPASCYTRGSYERAASFAVTSLGRGPPNRQPGLESDEFHLGHSRVQPNERRADGLRVER